MGVLTGLLTYITSLSVISDWFDTAGDVLTELGEFLVNMFNAVYGVFYDSTANSGAGQLTIAGIFLVAGFVLTSVWIAFRLIRNLVRMRG